MAAKDEIQQKRDENVPPEDHHSEEPRSQLPRPAGTSALPFRHLNNMPRSNYRVTGKDRLRQFCLQVLRDTPSSLPPPESQESPQLVSTDSSKQKPVDRADADRRCSEAPTPVSPVQRQQPSGIARTISERNVATVSTGHVHTGQASPKVAAASKCTAQCRQLSGIPRATGRPRAYNTGSDYRVLLSTPNASPGLGASLTASGSHETDGTTDSADTSTSSDGRCTHPPLVPDVFSPDFDKYRELLRQDRIECYGRDFPPSPVFAVGDLSPVLTPPPAVPLLALNSVHNAQQITAVPSPDSPAHYTDSPKWLEGSPTAKFQLPASVVWKRSRHGRRRSSATPPRVSPGSRIGHAGASPRPEERDSSDGGGSGSSTSRGDGSPGVITSGFRTPDVDNFCRRVRAEIAESYTIAPQLSPAESVESVWTDLAKYHSMSPRTPDVDNFRRRVRAEIAESCTIAPQLSPAESVESVWTDLAKYHSMSPLLSPANFIKTTPVEVQDSALTPSPVPSPPPMLAWARNGPIASLAARRRLSTVLESSQEISYTTICGTTALGPALEESYLIDARQPTLVDATFSASIPAMTSELVETEEELPADHMSDSLASFIENERMIMEEFGVNCSS